MCSPVGWAGNVFESVCFRIKINTILAEDHFWSQNRFKIGSKAVSEGLWMRIAFRSSKKRGRSRAREHKLEGFGASVGRETGRGQKLHTPDNLSKDRGRRIIWPDKRTDAENRFNPLGWTGEGGKEGTGLLLLDSSYITSCVLLEKTGAKVLPLASGASANMPSAQDRALS